MRIHALLLALALVLCSCSQQRAQVAVQSSLTAAAHVVAAVDQELASRIPPMVEEIAHEVRRERLESPVEMPPEHWLSVLVVRLEPLAQVTRALRVIKEALLTAQGALTAWIEGGELPEEWGPFCDGVGDAASHLLEALDAAGVDGIPEQVRTVVGMLDEACAVAGPYFSR